MTLSPTSTFVVLTTALVVLASIGLYWAQGKAITPRTCWANGGLYFSQPINTDDRLVPIRGWLISRANIRQIEVYAKNRKIAASAVMTPSPGRPQRLQGCLLNFPVSFALSVPLSSLHPRATELDVYALNTKGTRFSLGKIPVDLTLPFAHLDGPKTIQLEGRNLIGGWAIARDGPVKLRVLAQGKQIMEVYAKLPRQDVADLFLDWPQARTSGFDEVLSMKNLPRGHYHLQIIYDDGRGHIREVRGPEVINDLPFGKVLAQHERLLNPEQIDLTAWLTDEQGIQSARAETEDGVILDELHMSQAQVPLTALPDPRFGTAPSPDVPIKLGNLYRARLAGSKLAPGLHRLIVRVKDNNAREALLPGPLVLNQATPPLRTCAGAKRRVFYPGGAVDFRDGFRQMKELRALVGTGCVEVGVRGRVEYLRTTRGKGADFEFDPAFPENLRGRNGGMTGESLNELLDTALKFKAPLLITLDGGVWADAKFSAPDVDIVDNLEQDPRTVQWNQFGRPEADDALQHLPGATESPQLARVMSLNRYNTRFRHYKKRNLQAAVREIVRFSKLHPGTYVAITLEPDLYINPWFFLTQWYDYNPDTLRQYREWLFHLGPYADGGELASTRHAPKLTLAEANQMGRATWTVLDQVEPPRGALDYTDPWQQLWTQFKRHLVARHYDDLAAWAVAAGLPMDRVYTAQTFIQTDVAFSVTDIATGWTDQAGVSITGAKPKAGHLGAILYGPSSRNQGPSRNQNTLINNIRLVDPEWAVVEYHPATISFPEKLPSAEESYATVFNILNGGARFLSPMWGSFVGDRVVRPSNFKSYDAMEGTAYEYQLVWWLHALRGLPLDSFFYPFGNSQVKSKDGWEGTPGVQVDSQPGKLQLSGKNVPLSVLSPHWAAVALDRAATLNVSTIADPLETPPYAELIMDNGARLNCAMLKNKEGIWQCSFAKAPGRMLDRIRLSWNAQGSPGKIVLDSVTLRFP